MDVKQAWESFARTGKVEDYIRYTQIRNQTEAQAAVPGEARREAEDPGAHYPGTDGGGERPPHYDPHP